MPTLDSNNFCPCYIVYIKLNKKFSVIYTYTIFANCKYLHKLYIKQGFLYNCKTICIQKVTFALFLIFYMHCIFLGMKTWMTHIRQHSANGFHILVNWGQFVHLPLFLYWGLEVLKILNLKSTDIREITLTKHQVKNFKSF